MDLTGTTSDFSKHGRDLADKAANKIQYGLQDAERTVNRAANQLSGKADKLRSDAKPWFKKTTQQTQSIVQVVGDAASQASESVNAYAKENPFKAILIAAASGAVLATLFRTISRLRD